MKIFESFRELNESKDIEWIFKNLRKNHPRSSNTEMFISKVNDLLDGKIDDVPRSFFRLGMGKQFGLEFIDQLVENGVLINIKRGRTEFLVSPESKIGINTKEDELFSDLESELRDRERKYGNIHNVIWVIDEKNRTITFKLSDFVITWLHYEKGHGKKTSGSEQTQSEKDIIDKLMNSHLVKFVIDKYNEIYKSSEFVITNTTKESERSFHPDGHKGYLYTVEGIIKK